MARSAPNREFLTEVAHQFQEGIRRRAVAARIQGERYTRMHAAKELGVSRASLQFYLAGKHLPSSEVLRRAIELWGIEPVYRGRKLSLVDFTAPKSAARLRKSPVQLSLWDSIKLLENRSLSISVEKKSPKSITLRVEIEFKSA